MHLTLVFSCAGRHPSIRTSHLFTVRLKERDRSVASSSVESLRASFLDLFISVSFFKCCELRKIGHFWRISCTAFRLLINHLLPITQKPLSVPVRPRLETYLQLARLRSLLSLRQQGGVRAEKAEMEEEGSKNNLPEIR